MLGGGTDGHFEGLTKTQCPCRLAANIQLQQAIHMLAHYITELHCYRNSLQLLRIIQQLLPKELHELDLSTMTSVHVHAILT